MTVDVNGVFVHAEIAKPDAHPIARFYHQRFCGRKDLAVKGEDVDITNIEALITLTNTAYSSATTTITDLTNGVFYDVESGTSVTGASDPTVTGTVGLAATGGVTSTDTISLGVGVHKIGLKVDLNSDFDTNDIINSMIDPGNYLTVTGQVTGNAITATGSNNNCSTLTIKTAKVAVSAASSPAATTVVKGTSDFIVANIQLDTNGSGDDVTISQLKTVLRTDGTMTTDELSGLRIFDGDTEINVSNDPDNTLAAAGTPVTTTWSFSPALSVARNTVKTLTVKVDIDSTPTANEWFKVGFQQGCTVTAKDSTGEDASTTYYYSDGSAMTIASAGTLTLVKSGSYENSFLNGKYTGQGNLTIGEMRMTAVNENINVESLYVDIASYTGNEGTNQFLAAYLYDGADLLKQATITSSDKTDPIYFNMESDPILIEVGTEREISLVMAPAVISKMTGIPTNGVPGEGFTPSIASAKMTIKGVSGTSANFSSATTITFPNYVMVKSQPTVTLSQTGDDVTTNTTYDLIDVAVSADSAGPIGLYKMTFKVATTAATVSDFEVYEGTTLVATEDATATEGINVSYVDNNYTVVEVYFNKLTLGGEMREIDAGETLTYTLRGTISGYTDSTSSVATAILGDDAMASSAYDKNAVAVDAVDDDDFIWSDLAYGGTSDTATTTVEWLNGFLVEGLLTTTSSAKSI